MAKKRQHEKLIDELLADYDGPESFWGESGLFTQLKKKMVERALAAEMDDHLGYPASMIPKVITVSPGALNTTSMGAFKTHQSF